MDKTRILYLDAKRYPSGGSEKLPGIRRYCATRKWGVSAIYRDDGNPGLLRRRLPSLLAALRPAGCIVESSWADGLLPPSLFGAIPVAYLDYQEGTRLDRPADTVACDNEAATEMAFRELSVNLPSCYAAIPGLKMRSWSDTRVGRFRALCEGEGKPCHAFPGKAGEIRDERLARLCAWVKALPRNCAIFGANDYSASDVVQALAADGRAVPYDATVVGIDGHTGLPDPSEGKVTTIRLDFEQGGYLAAQMLARRIDAADGGGAEAAPAGGSALFGPSIVLRRKSTAGRGRRERRVVEALAVIRAKACAGLTARDLAARFGGNRSHFEQRFREATGHSILNEILHVRLEGVLSCLAQPNMPISAIADFCGFGSGIELRRLFRRRFGCSMRQWREDHAKSRGAGK